MGAPPTGSNLRKALTFGAQFLPLFVLFIWVFLKVLPSYQSLVLGTANVVTERLSPATRMEIREGGGWQLNEVAPHGAERKLKRWSTDVAPLIFLSLAMLPALILATPATMLQRLRTLAIGIPLLYLIHVLSVIGVMRGVLCQDVTPGKFHCLWILRVSHASGQLAGAALWALLTWQYWLPGFGRGRSALTEDPVGEPAARSGEPGDEARGP